MKPHKHAELIKAWADGAEIQQRNFYYAPRKWSDWLVFNGTWIDEDSTEYRIKPEPKPDVIRYLLSLPEKLSFNYQWSEFACEQLGEDRAYISPQIKLTFDGETGKLKSAEVLK